MPTFPAPTFTEAEFRKASRSQPNGDCVQVARRDGWVAVRDDKTPFGTRDDHRLLVPATDFDCALTAWRTGGDGPIQITPRDSRHDLVLRRSDGNGPDLAFSPDEIDAFLDGVTRGEFDDRP